jgi:hypothetical protein
MSNEVISIIEWTGPTGNPVPNEVTTIRFCSANEVADGLVHPCKVPPVGTDQYNSFGKTLCLKLVSGFVDGSNTRFWGPQNIKAIWFPGTPATGRMVVGRKDNATNGHGFLYTDYEAPQGTIGTTGIAMKTPVTGHSQYNTQTISVVDVDLLTQNAPLVVDTAHYTAHNSYTRCIYIQTEILPTADHGDMIPVTLVWAVELV